MTLKRILIVDDEASVLSILQRSLNVLGENYEVSTALDGRSALLLATQSPFDLIITDYKMAGMDGLELIEAIQALKTGARIILMTAYGNEKVEIQARRLQVYRYLTKPLRVDQFRQVVQGALINTASSRPGISMVSRERQFEITAALEHLCKQVGARCVVLAEVEGSCIAYAGNLQGFPIEGIAPLLGGCVAGLGEAGRLLDGDKNIINLIYRESPTEDLYIINIGAQRLLLVVVDRGPYSSKLGTVWYLVQPVAAMLFRQLHKSEFADTNGLFDGSLSQAMGDELEKLFDPAGQPPAQSHPDAAPQPDQEMRVPILSMQFQREREGK